MPSTSVSMRPEFPPRGPVDRPQYASSNSPEGLPLAQPPLENRQRMTQEQLLHDQGRSLEAGPKIRLRKACDSCAIRKVKCDVTGPPCRACAGLDIPCTFDRPIRRRGPPNRHADAIKKLQFDSPGSSGGSAPSSPMHAAQTFTSLPQHQGLSAEAILPIPILKLFVSDYFTFLHPLIPVPHEPSFLDALDRREDLSSPTFLALLASMVGCLVASFPRRPRKHLKAYRMGEAFPNSVSLVERCHSVTVEALGPGYLDRDFTVHDAVISYLRGLTGGYTYNWRSARVYFGQCLTILRIIGLHKASYSGTGSAGTSSSTRFSGADDGPRDRGGNLILRELGRRTFWLMFVGGKSLQQVGASSGEFWIPPATLSDPYPPLPLEVDDAYLTPTHVLPQPPGVISMLVGFNANVRIYSAYNNLSTFELTYGVDEIFDWDRQARMLEHSLQATKQMLDEVPEELRLNLKTHFAEAGASQYPVPTQLHVNSHGNVHRRGNGFNDIIGKRRRVQYEIQKANIYVSQLATRSYLVEKYWSLHRSQNSTTLGTQSKPNPPESQREASEHDPNIPDPSSRFDLTEQRMADEREDVVKDLLHVLGMFSQVDIEPNGASFMNKVRQIASTLLEVPHTRQGEYAICAEEYLHAFLEALLKLELASPASSAERDGFMEGHSVAAEGEDEDEDEEAQLRHWAGLRKYQQRFAEAGGFSSEA